ncbi:WW domain-containing oxidoreductase-like isoform X3 [Choristoneura fumiferana]|uniref:WW domain-containing oxidoreductase-like isoform X3 n=1 Tax=Choristoneura fumiferana TaxID=7141 RepID=UPI003D153604
MHITYCLRAIWPAGVQFRFVTKTLLPQACGLIRSTAKAVSDAGYVKIFGPTAEEVVKDIDLKDKTCLITGANSGLGLEMTRCLVGRDCSVIMACRNPYAGSIVVRNVFDNNPLLKLRELNLASLKSVKKFSDDLVKEDKNVRWSVEKRLVPTEDQLSLPADKYTSIKAYNVSKLCGVLAMHYFGYRWLGSNKSVFAAHPGSFIKTRLSRNWWPYELLYYAMQPFSKSVRQAASTPLFCAASPALAGLSAVYVRDCQRRAESDLALDSHLSFRVMDLTLDMLRERTPAVDPAPARDQPKQPASDAKHAIDDEHNLISNYSG